MEQTCNFYVLPTNLVTVSKQLNNYANTTHTCNNQTFEKIPVKKLNVLGWGSPPPCKSMLYPYSLFC